LALNPTPVGNGKCNDEYSISRFSVENSQPNDCFWLRPCENDFWFFHQARLWAHLIWRGGFVAFSGFGCRHGLDQWPDLDDSARF
jgi:hypothetical protein